MKVLLLQHFESYWEGPLQDLHNTSFEECMNKVLDFVIATDDLDKIIITLFEDHELNHEYETLQRLCDNKGIEIEAHNYGYAWYRDPDEEDNGYPEDKRNIDWCQGTRDHHGDEDVIEIHDWQKDLKTQNDVVLLGGAFDTECIFDMMAALDTLEVNYERVEGLIVGSGHDYEFVLETASEVESTLMCAMSDMADKLNDLLSDFDDDEDALIEEELDSLVEIETTLNRMVSENRKVIDAYDIEYSSENTIVNEIVDNNIRNGVPYTRYSDMADERNLIAIKSKLKENDTPVEKPVENTKLKQKNRLSA